MFLIQQPTCKFQTSMNICNKTDDSMDWYLSLFKVCANSISPAKNVQLFKYSYCFMLQLL